ncbi:HEAT repeat domain-containing protein [Thalassobellus suaedae]|uniref:HEAT repeat domain-containing protein n=1 Tax=Thalassobellus suaedae TaxID=3074124 RepID=A0ABY9Y507_9FLAO|nr:HEAT repeat domain-containing protein [Flavobacteriaceae bacterium HL-DH10]
MYYQIAYILFKLKLIQPSENAISFWMQNNHVKKLEYALKFGNYKTRQLAAEALEFAGKPSSIPVLLDAISDKVQNVSIAALNALERIDPEDEIIKTVIKKRFHWVTQIREASKKREANKGKKHKIYKWERASKKSFERVKEQLKRPMR